MTDTNPPIQKQENNLNIINEMIDVPEQDTSSSEVDMEINYFPEGIPEASAQQIAHSCSEIKKRGRPPADNVKSKRIDQMRCMDNIKTLFNILTRGQKRMTLANLISLL